MDASFNSVLGITTDFYEKEVIFSLNVRTVFNPNGMSVEEARAYANEYMEQKRLDRVVGPRYAPGYAELNAIRRAQERKERCSIPNKKVGKWISTRSTLQP